MAERERKLREQLQAATTKVGEMASELNEARGRADLAMTAEAAAREAQLAAQAQCRDLERLMQEMSSELQLARTEAQSYEQQAAMAEGRAADAARAADEAQVAAQGEGGGGARGEMR